MGDSVCLGLSSWMLCGLMVAIGGSWELERGTRGESGPPKLPVHSAPRGGGKMPGSNQDQDPEDWCLGPGI